MTVALAVSIGVAIFLIATIMLKGSLMVPGLESDFYAIFPHNTLAVVFGGAFGFAILALGIGVTRFWREVSEPGRKVPLQNAVGEAAKSALTLQYLDGGHKDGCNNEDDAFTLWRRRFHHFTFYGFMLCFVSTSVATLYHYLFGMEAPYPIFSAPVILGTLGGIGLLIGPAGLLWLNLRRNPMQTDETQKTMDVGFIMLLFMISLTGLVLLAFRETASMPLLLAIHLGFVMGFFVTLPYSKFAHGIFRCAALLKYAIEKRRPNPVQAGAE